MSVTTGARRIVVHDAAADCEIPVVVFYPSAAAPETLRFGPYSLPGRMDAPTARGSMPLVLISHGTGGSNLVYRTLAAYLAQHGYVVAQPEHPGNNRNDNSLADTDENLRLRPKHLSLVVDALLSDVALGDQLRDEPVAIIGHSLGGYTGLALVGGVPQTGPAAEPIEVVPDPRIQALVLLAPATPWFQGPGALAAVTTPILMLTAEQDPFTPASHGQWVLDGLPAQTSIQHRIVLGAGHYSFLSPFPPGMQTPGFAPAHDPPGFDRQAFHDVLYPEILEFLNGALAKD